MMLRVHILSKELTYIKLKIVLCSLQDIHELMNFSCQPPTLGAYCPSIYTVVSVLYATQFLEDIRIILARKTREESPKQNELVSKAFASNAVGVSN